MTYLIPQRAGCHGSNAEGVHQLKAQGCARQRATLGKGRVDTPNPEGVANKKSSSPISFRIILKNSFRVRAGFHSASPKVARWRAQPWAFQFVNAFGVIEN
jgi:hypothetical protein